MTTFSHTQVSGSDGAVHLVTFFEGSAAFGRTREEDSRPEQEPVFLAWLERSILRRNHEVRYLGPVPLHAVKQS